MRLLTVVGARPQFIKAAAISRCLKHNQYSEVEEKIVHTGQHYDSQMSDTFFSELGVPEPSWNLHAGQIKDTDHQLGAMISGIKKIIADWLPNCVLVYGDTNSTLAGALAAASFGVPLAHVEAGLRSYRSTMPEEINRVICDRLSNILFCPTNQAVENLNSEGRYDHVHLVGDVMYDVFKREMNLIRSENLENVDFFSEKFVLSTIHRAENTNDPIRLQCLADALSLTAESIGVVLPLHPRTRRDIERFNIIFSDRVRIIEPLSYKELLSVLARSSVVATDSGGLQKEAYFAAVPCVTLREETEWVETVESGWNILLPPTGGTDAARDISSGIMMALEKRNKTAPPEIYGDGNAAGKILQVVLNL
ncbi:hypothetical protein TH24_21295 [Thalassospira xiamenensis]|nr:hypothetical protein TH24_21295 [Thalassospira xiamenensis]